MKPDEKNPSIPVNDEITPEMLAELSHGKGDDNHE